MDGWIKLPNSLKNVEWLMNDLERLGWYVDLLYNTTWTNRTVKREGHVFSLTRGQQIVSQRVLQKRWSKKDDSGEIVGKGISRDAVDKFLSFLEESSLIKREILERGNRRFTLITVCDYDCCEYEENVSQPTSYQCATNVLPTFSQHPTNILPTSYQCATTLEDSKNVISKEDKKEEINKETVSDDTVKKVPDRNLKFEKAAELWNEICGDVLPKVIKLTDTRRKKITARVLESKCKTMDEWTAWLTDYFKKLRASDFATKGTWCSFDWAFDNGNNWVKTMEGNYDNKETAQDTRHMTIQERVMAEHPNMRLNEAAYEHIAKDGRRTYGSSETKTVPYDAPPRPNNFYVWCEPTQEWVANY